MLLLCYHKVGPEAEVGRPLATGEETLRAHIRLLRRRGYGFRTARDSLRREARTVQLHFDDAYASALERGRRVLDDEDVPATFWAVPGFVGGRSEWDGERAAPLAGWQALIEAAAAGHEIGNHTLSHRRLADLDPPAREAEIARGREELRVRGFCEGNVCYPWGSHDPRIAESLARLGIPCGFSLAKRPCRDSDPLWALPRIALSRSDGPARLLYKIHVRPHLP